MENTNQKPMTTPEKDPHTEELVDHYWGTIEYLSGLIKASEIKAGLILSFYGIVLNFVYQSIETLLNQISNNIILYGLIILWVFCTVGSIFFCIRCFIPKIEGSYDKNMFFFKDIISKFGDIKAFSKAFLIMSKNEEALFSQLGEQIFIISKISDWKFKNVKRAISLLAIGLIFLFAIVLYHTFLTLA